MSNVIFNIPGQAFDVNAGNIIISANQSMAENVNYSLIWPTNNGANGGVLMTDGNNPGNLSWYSLLDVINNLQIQINNLQTQITNLQNNSSYEVINHV
jgi:hypothetical protein